MASPLASLVCGICHEDGLEEIGELDSCFHKFCFPCISRWAEIESRCPFCKERFARLRRKQLFPGAEAVAAADPNAELPGIYLDDGLAVPERNQASAIASTHGGGRRIVYEDPDFQQFLNDLACLGCGGAQDEDCLLLCDGCERACHTYCAGLAGVPEGEWYCPACEAARAAPALRGRRRGRGLEAPLAQEQGPRRRRQRRVEVVELSESEEEEWAGSSAEEEGEGQPVRRRRAPRGRAAGGRVGHGAQGSRGAGRRGGGRDLADFLTSASEDDDAGWGGSQDADFVPASRPAVRGAAAAQRPGRGARPRRGGGRGGGRRGQRARAAADRSQGSADSEQDLWMGGDEGPEADSTDSEAEEEAEEHGTSGGDEELRPLAQRLRARGDGGGGASAAATGGAGRARGGRGARVPQRAPTAFGQRGRRRQGGVQEEEEEEEEEGLVSADHRAVAERRQLWDDYRAGRASFPVAAQPRQAQGPAGRAAGPARQQARRRLRRLADVAGAAGGGREGGGWRGSQEAAEVVDLVSPSPPRGGLASRDMDEAQAWANLETALQQRSQVRQSGGGGGAARVGAPPPSPAPGRGAASPAEEDWDVPLAQRVRREIATARERGARLLPRHLPPGSAVRRTVADARWAAAVASGGTPGSGLRMPGSAGRQGGSAGRGAALPFVIPKRQLSPPTSNLQQRQQPPPPPPQQPQQRTQRLEQEAGCSGAGGGRSNPFSRWALPGEPPQPPQPLPPPVAAPVATAVRPPWQRHAELPAALRPQLMDERPGLQSSSQPARGQLQPWQQPWQQEHARAGFTLAPAPRPAHGAAPPPPSCAGPLEGSLLQGALRQEARQPEGAPWDGTPASTGAPGGAEDVVPDSVSPGAQPLAPSLTPALSPAWLASAGGGAQAAARVGAGEGGGGRQERTRKQEVLDGIKPLLKAELHARRLTSEQYKAMAKRATHALLELGRPFSSEEAAAAVRDAAQQRPGAAAARRLPSSG
eukprot:scaffold12.g7944.t1